MLDWVLREPPLPTVLWQWLTLSALAGSAGAFVVAAHRSLELGRPRSERAVGLVWLVGASAFGLVLAAERPAAIEVVLLAWAVATAGVGAYFVRLLFLVRDRLPERSFRFAAPLGVLGFALALHDIALGMGIGVPLRVVLIPYLGTLIALFGVWRVLELLADALTASESLNRDLERRVAERGEEIARSYERVRQLEREQLLQTERERLMRDIHDGLGAQLTSTLAAVESEDTARGEIEDALRDTLDDMRLLVASLAPGSDDLVALLARWRGRIARRLERRGIVFDWRVSDLPPLPWLGPSEAMSALRIFQEAVSNVVQHAEASTIRVSTGCIADDGGQPGVFVEICDDGRGLGRSPPRVGEGNPTNPTAEPAAGQLGPSPATTASGFGMRNMARRAAELGGSITVADGSPGTRVLLWLPLARPGESPVRDSRSARRS
jgi:signal transduction histidine kinase